MVERDLARWQSAGWLSDAGAAAIRAELAANWNEMSKLSRLSLLLTVLRVCYCGAAWLFARQLAGFANAAVLGGIAVYGASII
jgi:uncharacterized membrane protein